MHVFRVAFSHYSIKRTIHEIIIGIGQIIAANSILFT